MIRLLLSYAFFGDDDLDARLAALAAKPYPEFFADSGAYTAQTQGQKVDVVAYADWLHRWSHHFSACANLDVIGHVDKGLKHLAYLESRGLHPIPVFHTGEPWSVLRDMVASYDYVGLGFLTNMPAKPRMHWLVRCFEIGAGKAVFHAFGMGTQEVLYTLPWFSVDSTFWSAGVRYGRLLIFDPVSRRLDYVEKEDRSVFKRGRLLRSLGGNPSELLHTANKPSHTDTVLVSMRSHVLLEAFLRTRHGDIRPPRSSPLLKTPPDHQTGLTGPKIILGLLPAWDSMLAFKVHNEELRHENT